MNNLLDKLDLYKDFIYLHNGQVADAKWDGEVRINVFAKDNVSSPWKTAITTRRGEEISRHVVRRDGGIEIWLQELSQSEYFDIDPDLVDRVEAYLYDEKDQYLTKFPISKAKLKYSTHHTTTTTNLHVELGECIVFPPPDPF